MQHFISHTSVLTCFCAVMMLTILLPDRMHAIAQPAPAASQDPQVRVAASALWHTNQRTAAIELLEKAVASSPQAHEHIRQLRQLGQYQLWNRKTDDAGRTFARIRTLFQNDDAALMAMPHLYAQSVMNLALIAREQDHLEGALDLLEEALDKPLDLLGEEHHLRLAMLYASMQPDVTRSQARIAAARATCANAWQASPFQYETTFYSLCKDAGIASPDIRPLVDHWQSLRANTDPDAIYAAITLINDHFARGRNADALDIAFEASLRLHAWSSHRRLDPAIDPILKQAADDDWKSLERSILSVLQTAASHGRPEYVELAEQLLAEIGPAPTDQSPI